MNEIAQRTGRRAASQQSAQGRGIREAEAIEGVVKAMFDELYRIEGAVRNGGRCDWSEDRPVSERVARVRQMLAASPDLPRKLADTCAPASEDELAAFLAATVGCFPNVGGADMSVFGRMLVSDVAALSPSRGALELGCRELRRSSKFLPAISEFLAAITKAEGNLKAQAGYIANADVMLARADQFLAEQQRIAEEDKAAIRRRIVDGKPTDRCASKLVDEVHRELGFQHDSDEDQ